jgi:NTP pyrophosphatase (non-canonical NTP hydrolase)
MSFADLELKVVRWAEARSIVQNSNPAAQARKTLEEAGELVAAASSVRAAHPADSMLPVWRNEYKDALGDVLVTLIVGAATADVDLMECLAQAYDEIKDRKGTLRADGVFVKES